MVRRTPKRKVARSNRAGRASLSQAFDCLRHFCAKGEYARLYNWDVSKILRQEAKIKEHFPNYLIGRNGTDKTQENPRERPQGGRFAGGYSIWILSASF